MPAEPGFRSEMSRYFACNKIFGVGCSVAKRKKVAMDEVKMPVSHGGWRWKCLVCVPVAEPVGSDTVSILTGFTRSTGWLLLILTRGFLSGKQALRAEPLVPR